MSAEMLEKSDGEAVSDVISRHKRPSRVRDNVEDVEYVRLDDLISDVLVSINSSPKADEAIEAIEKLKAKTWLAPNDRRFAIAVFLARALVHSCHSNNLRDDAPIVDYFAEDICTHLKDRQYTGREPQVIASLLLAPQHLYDIVKENFPENISMISALFSMPLSAAKMRYEFDQGVAKAANERANP